MRVKFFGLQPDRRWIKAQSIHNGLSMRNALGRRIQIKGMSPRHNKDYIEHLLRLSETDRHTRFMAALSDQALAKTIKNRDCSAMLAFGAFAGGSVRGVAELCQTRNDRLGEFALTVENEYRRMHLGTLLTAAVLLAGRTAGLERAVFQFEADNQAMSAIARLVGAHVSTVDGVGEARVELSGRCCAFEAQRYTRLGVSG